MANCPKCGAQVDDPNKKLENSAFKIALYKCRACQTKFITSWGASEKN